jgi:hypothetical protein
LLLDAALIVGLALATPESMAPRLSADLDGDGAADVATATATRGVVNLEVRGGTKNAAAARAKAPAPAEDVVRVSLTAAPLGSVGSLLEVAVSTDASECLSVWRYKDGALTRLPIRGAGGRALPDCAPPGDWTHRWERTAPDAPSALVREETTKIARGTLRRRETYAFAGFSLDLDPARSTADVDGVLIPSWYSARYYTQKGLDLLYSRFDSAAFRATPRLTIETDPAKGVFELRFTTPAREVVAPVESFSSVVAEGTASIVARAGDDTVHASIRLGGDGNVPVEILVDGLGSELDNFYGPAGAWHGRARQVFPSAADEMASEHLTGTWGTPKGGKVQMQFDGAPPYRMRVDQGLFAVDFDHTPKSAGADVALLPTDGSRRGWGITLEGPNALDLFPLDCGAGGDGSGCRPDGSSERLRRLGARINVR